MMLFTPWLPLHQGMLRGLKRLLINTVQDMQTKWRPLGPTKSLLQIPYVTLMIMLYWFPLLKYWKTVDVVYIGTPHTHHYTNAKLALTAHKHVLCEKPFTSNAAELHSLIELAKANSVFLMEALWTRFLPVSLELKRLVDNEELGEIQSVHADLSDDFKIESTHCSSLVLNLYLVLIIANT